MSRLSFVCLVRRVCVWTWLCLCLWRGLPLHLLIVRTRLLTICSMFLYTFDFSWAVCSSILVLSLRPLSPALCALHFPFVRCGPIIVACWILPFSLQLLHSRVWCWLFWIVFCLLVAPRNVSFVGSPLEVIASFCDRLIVFHFRLPVACVSPLELAECWEDRCSVGSRLYRWRVVGGLVLLANSRCRPVSWFLLRPVVLHAWFCLHVWWLDLWSFCVGSRLCRLVVLFWWF